MSLTISERGRTSRLSGAVLDASLYDRFASKFAALDLHQMVGELRKWTDETPASQSVAAMARLLDLSIMSEILTERDRRRAAKLAVVVELIVRKVLGRDTAAITTIDGAHRLLLRYGEANSPCADVIRWMSIERHRRGMPSLD